MSTATMEKASATTIGDGRRVTLGRVARSEWIKLRSLRSLVITLAIAAVVIIGFGLIASATSSGDLTGPNGGGAGQDFGDALSTSLAGSMFGQLVVGIFGVLLVAGEYSTGMIRSTLAAVPKRWPVLAGKSIVAAACVCVVSLVSVGAAFFGGQALLAGADKDISITDSGVLGALVGNVGYLVGIALIGLALGVLLRNTAGAIAIIVVVLLLAPGLIGLLPDSIGNAIVKFLPSNAAESFTSLTTTGDVLSAGAGIAVFVGYVVVALSAATVVLRRRDA